MKKTLTYALTVLLGIAGVGVFATSVYNLVNLKNDSYYEMGESYEFSLVSTEWELDSLLSVYTNNFTNTDFQLHIVDPIYDLENDGYTHISINAYIFSINDVIEYFEPSDPEIYFELDNDQLFTYFVGTTSVETNLPAIYNSGLDYLKVEILKYHPESNKYTGLWTTLLVLSPLIFTGGFIVYMLRKRSY